MVRRYTVSLNEPAQTRWSHVLQDNKSKLDASMKELDSIVPSGFIFKLVEWILAVCVYLNIVYYSDEIKAISKYTKISVGRLVILQLYYELNAHCTSILTNTDSGVCLTRTMDWDLDLLKDLTIIVDFTKNNQVLFSATTWVGYVGIFTGVKQDVFAVSLNYRRVSNPLYVNLINRDEDYFQTVHT
ncbi:hypothetical protein YASMINEVIRUS_754 [Yasminevirus sp. GU-2018]|uniref:Acid ceramidase N-terminal domain-containing protein n=1 Tax=Yasminevirus sp. GU-2018 TaxID=2420051 RepID=A0A5K0U9N5_9VIRU|nr:hypothetical protein YASMINEVIRUS_754 [Yasminevirus sp. GU-2018]